LNGRRPYRRERPVQFRIVEIGELENPDLEDVHGVWIVEPASGSQPVSARSRGSASFGQRRRATVVWLVRG
jgi:hypothetical protein